MFLTDIDDRSFRTAEKINEAMARVYAHMGIAVLISMMISYMVGSSQIGRAHV